jgi:hypothetical protein
MVLMMLCELCSNSRLLHVTDVRSELAKQALDLNENLFVVRPYGSFTGENPPTECTLRRQADWACKARRRLQYQTSNELYD